MVIKLIIGLILLLDLLVLLRPLLPLRRTPRGMAAFYIMKAGQAAQRFTLPPSG
jgi:hypothetical protein